MVLESGLIGGKPDWCTSKSIKLKYGILPARPIDASMAPRISGLQPLQTVTIMVRNAIGGGGNDLSS